MRPLSGMCDRDDDVWAGMEEFDRRLNRAKIAKELWEAERASLTGPVAKYLARFFPTRIPGFNAYDDAAAERAITAARASWRVELESFQDVA